jgi:hypothetical protein
MWGDPGVGGRIILGWIIRKCSVGDKEWNGLAQDRDRRASNCECGNESSGLINAGNFLTSYKPVSFPRRTLLHGVSK